ncbi:hypothetical protein MMC06_006251 [Schaereria dolodes]|nr:hypothetical protein [Schaereria dolodes]
MDPEWKCPYAHNHTGTVTRNPVWAGEFQGTPAAHRATATRESTSQRSRNMPSGEIGPVQQTIDLILKDADICQLKENIIAGQSSYIKVGLINTFSIAESIDRSCVNLTALMKEMELMEPASQHAKTLGNEIRKLSEAGEDLQSLTEMFAGAKEDVEDLLKATGLNAQFGAENK